MPGWTLNYEMFFYLIFGLWLSAPRRFRFFGTVGCIFALIATGMITRPPYPSIIGFYESPIMGEFALGMALGWLMTSTSIFARAPLVLGYVMAICCLLGVVGLFGALSLPRLYTSGLAAFGLVAGVLILENHKKVPLLRLPHLIGNASYSIYLSQLMSMSLFSQIWRKIIHYDGSVTWITFCIICT